MIKKGKYRHFKGNEYEVIDIAEHTESGEILVIYKGIYESGKVWARPITMWDEEVVYEGKRVKRFTYMGE